MRLSRTTAREDWRQVVRRKRARRKVRTVPLRTGGGVWSYAAPQKCLGPGRLCRVSSCVSGVLLCEPSCAPLSESLLWEFGVGASSLHCKTCAMRSFVAPSNKNGCALRQSSRSWPWCRYSSCLYRKSWTPTRCYAERLESFCCFRLRRTCTWRTCGTRKRRNTRWSTRRRGCRGWWASVTTGNGRTEERLLSAG